MPEGSLVKDKPKRILIPYKPREQFKAFHARKQRWSIGVTHVRAGKTVAGINDLIKGALTCPLPEPRFAYIAPTYGQAKDVAWSYLTKFALAVPGAVPHESELRVDFPHNKSRVRLYGADNYDRMRGIYLDGALMDEYGDMDPRVWPEVVRPRLSDRKGWGAFIGTPRGQNHFADLWELASGDPEWFTLMLKASETGILDETELADARRHMTAEQYAAEYECSFFGSVVGAYYGAEISALEADGKVGDFGWLPKLAVHTVLDTGNTTAQWYFQNEGSNVRVIDYLEGVNQTAAWYKKQMDEKPYTYGSHYLPADADDEKEIVGLSWKQSFENLGLKNLFVLPRQVSVDAGINNAKMLLPRCRFDAEKTKDGLTGLRNYRRQWDSGRKVFRDQPLHDWASHPADGFRYLAVAVDQGDASSDWSKPIAYDPRWIT